MSCGFYQSRLKGGKVTRGNSGDRRRETGDRSQELQEFRSTGELESWSAGELECWRAGELECWRAGELESWSAGVLECWSAGVLEFRSSEPKVLYGIG
jgi:hypothetical protein